MLKKVTPVESLIMPHKHKRDKSNNDPSYDLPPTALAHPLPVFKSTNHSSKVKRPESTLRKKPRSKKTLKDDTPRAFARLMNYQATGQKPPKGLDDGAPISRKRKRKADTSTGAQNPPVPTPSLPTLLPSESLSAFSARVDAAIPISGLAKSKRSSTLAVSPRERQTKMEKRMQKMQAEWREGAAKRREKLAEEEEEESGEGDGHGMTGGGNDITALVSKSKNKGKGKGKSKRRRIQAVTDDAPGADEDDDPWAAIAAKRIENTKISAHASGGLVGLHDVVLAPPKLKAPRERIRPHTSGIGGGKSTLGLRRQEEMGEARRSVVEGYRRMMGERRGKG